uniref:Peptidase S1 domain-containing protein n=1 Tax=Trichuris muris TaxID=70415 RepID=A0A5S6QID6_TRIMR
MWSFLVIAALFIETTSAILQCGLTIMAYKGKGTKGSHSSQISSVDSRFFPWMVMISGKFNKQQVPLCVGALIESGEITKTYYVLTSASCIHNV